MLSLRPRRWAPLACLLACVMLLHGCAGTSALARAEAAHGKLTVGMKRGEVLTRLGQPWRVRADPGGVTWTYCFEEGPAGGLVVLYVVGMVILVVITLGIFLLIAAATGGGSIGGNLPDGPDGPSSDYAFLRVHLADGLVDRLSVSGGRR